MSEPRGKRVRLMMEENVDLEPFPEAVNDRLISAARDMNPEAIKQALSEGAQPDLKIGNEDLVRFMRRTFLESHHYWAEEVEKAMFHRFLKSIRAFPNHARDLGDDWEFHLLRDFGFPENLFELLLESITPKWIDLILMSEQGLIPERYRDDIIGVILKKYPQRNSKLLKYLDNISLGRNNIVRFSNYPLFGIDGVKQMALNALENFDKLPEKGKLILCSVEPLRGGYTSQEDAIMSLLTRFSKEGFWALKTTPIRFWWDMVNIYLYGVQAMARNPDLRPLIPYVIETEAVPLAGHLDRVKFLPHFRESVLNTTMENIQNVLQALAKECHNDPTVRRYMETQLSN